ncbi:hypothetical protein CSUI_010815, partial [Cystoisospora suis]
KKGSCCMLSCFCHHVDHLREKRRNSLPRRNSISFSLRDKTCHSLSNVDEVI